MKKQYLISLLGITAIAFSSGGVLLNHNNTNTNNDYPAPTNIKVDIGSMQITTKDDYQPQLNENETASQSEVSTVNDTIEFTTGYNILDESAFIFDDGDKSGNLSNSDTLSGIELHVYYDANNQTSGLRIWQDNYLHFQYENDKTINFKYTILYNYTPPEGLNNTFAYDGEETKYLTDQTGIDYAGNYDEGYESFFVFSDPNDTDGNGNKGKILGAGWYFNASLNAKDDTWLPKINGQSIWEYKINDNTLDEVKVSTDGQDSRKPEIVANDSSPIEIYVDPKNNILQVKGTIISNNLEITKVELVYQNRTVVDESIINSNEKYIDFDLVAFDYSGNYEDYSIETFYEGGSGNTPTVWNGKMIDIWGLEVEEKDLSYLLKDTLGKWAIFGIIVTVLALIGIIGLILDFFQKKHNDPNNTLEKKLEKEVEKEVIKEISSVKKGIK